MKGVDVEKRASRYSESHKNPTESHQFTGKIFVETEKPWDDHEIQLDF